MYLAQSMRVLWIMYDRATFAKLIYGKPSPATETNTSSIWRLSTILQLSKKNGMVNHFVSIPKID